MKYIFGILFFFPCLLFAQSSIYDVEFNTLDQGPRSIADFKGKRLLIAVISPDNIEKGGFKFLDSIRSQYSKLDIIIIPAEDFGGDRNNEIVQSLKSKSSKDFVVADAQSVRKSNRQQTSLLQWLTNASSNFHFDREVNTDNQLYIVSESGILFALFEKGVPLAVIRQAIEQPESQLPEFKKH